jgi:hypothetical protein
MLGLLTAAVMLTIAILLVALDAARDNEREALRQLQYERERINHIEDLWNREKSGERETRSEASKKGWQTRKRREVVDRVMQQDSDIHALIGGGK